jgi:hypothetical protein
MPFTQKAAPAITPTSSATLTTSRPSMKASSCTGVSRQTAANTTISVVVIEIDTANPAKARAKEGVLLMGRSLSEVRGKAARLSALPRWARRQSQIGAISAQRSA